MFGRKKKIVVKMTDAELKASIIQSFQVIPDLVLDAVATSTTSMSSPHPKSGRKCSTS